MMEKRLVDWISVGGNVVPLEKANFILGREKFVTFEDRSQPKLKLRQFTYLESVFDDSRYDKVVTWTKRMKVL